MSKNIINYVCQNCGCSASKWSGKCEACGAWNQMVQESTSGTLKKSKKIDITTFFHNLQDPALKGENIQRLQTGNTEFDRVCGGGMVPGSVILIGGDPGIGKSTLLLQVVSHMSHNYECAYISGEEAISQIAMRAERLGFGNSHVHLAASTQLKETLSALNQMNKLDVVVIDSIQTLAHENIESAPGSVSQVRACAFELIQLAKKKGFILILVGHVTKEGTLAGPRVLEHMVDTVLYFEGDRGYDYRLLRSVKNRFGASDELGIFSMEASGLKEIQNPSELFISHHDEPLSGTAIYAGMEGTRPIMVEIQALVSPSSYAAPKRTTVGWDLNRLSMIVAVLESRCGLSFAGKDIYLSVVGGIKISEPAADLAVASALISSLKNEADHQTSVYFGEIGLTGEIRPVQKGDVRIREAMRLGFEHVVCAKRQFDDVSKFLLPVKELNILLEFLI
ncbi:MAG: DNA repair protein RadA [Candidatus Puniceispirillum sp.]|nr:DNA repair protein RadA [Candidatus Pelagibacter sp.]MBA4282742.1 DNA repair protein RadA [Candidatus Puniceispirillum sp.]